MFFWIILIVIIVILALFYSNIRVEVNFKRHDQNDILIITIIVLYGIFRFKKQIPFMDLVKGRKNVPALELQSESLLNAKNKSKDKSVINMKEFEKIFKRYKELYEKFKKYIIPFLRDIKPKLSINYITWKTEIGVNDAAYTAIITGAFWSIKSTIISLIHNHFNLHDGFIHVAPNYNYKTFKTSIDCIFTIKLGDIITVGMKTLIANKKDGEKNE